MKVVHIALYDRFGGGCIAGYRQHQALRRAGVDSRMWVRFKVTNDVNVSAFQPSLHLYPRISRLFRRYLHKFEWRQSGVFGEMFDVRSEHGKDMLQGMPQADIINIQFAWGFVDLPAFLRNLPNKVPVVVTMHESSAFTGGCSYAEQCIKFHNVCGNCPKLERAKNKDESYRQWSLKQKAYSLRRLHFVAVSNWLLNNAQSSPLTKHHSRSLIYNGLDTATFRPLDRKAARHALGIPSKATVVSFAAASLSDRRKGIAELVSALREAKEKLFLLTWGRGVPPELQEFKHLHLGNIESETLMAIAYSAADALVVPSLQENLPQTATESIACGTPVVAFSVGGIPEIVRDGETGLLAPVGDVRALKEAIEKMLNDKNLREKLGQRGVEVAREEFSYKKNAENYVKLYQSMLECGR